MRSYLNALKQYMTRKTRLILLPEQNKLLEKVYTSFVRSGANLEGEAKEQYHVLSKELSLLTLQFGENNLKETNDYKLVLTDPAQLAGLPQSATDAAAETAKRKRRGRMGIHPCRPLVTARL